MTTTLTPSRRRRVFFFGGSLHSVHREPVLSAPGRGHTVDDFFKPWCQARHTVAMIVSFPVCLPPPSDCLHGLSPGLFLLSYPGFVFSFFFIFPLLMPCTILSWPFCQLSMARQYAISYRIVLYRIVSYEA